MTQRIKPTKFTRNARRRDIQEMHLAGMDQHAIAKSLGITQPAISRHIRLLHEEWRNERLDNTGLMRDKQLKQLHGLLQKHSHLYKNGDDPYKALEGSRKVLTDIAKLFGLNQEKIDIKQDITVTEGVDPDTLASKLASVFSDDDIVDAEIVQPAALEHDTAPVDDILDDAALEHHEEVDDTIVDDDIDDGEEAVTEHPEAPDDTILDDLPCAPPPTRTGPNPGPVIGRMRPQLPGNDSVADDLSERLAARFST